MALMRSFLILCVCWLGFFHPLLMQPTGVLFAGYSDWIAEHLPAKVFAQREWQTHGELPLWNPYHFCGTPFVHDCQVGLFYPPYALMYLVPAERLGPALSWVIVLHTLLAGVLQFLYCRHRGVGELAALVAGAGVMFSAKWMTHLLLAGHTVTVGLAWLPLVLLGYERAIQHGRLMNLLIAGVACSLLVLGTHPQWAFYAIVFVALWTLGTAFEQKRLGRWLILGVLIGVIVALLTAVQLLPTLEASRHSTRTLGVEWDWSPRQVLALWVQLTGPMPVYAPPDVWEDRALLGAIWLGCALSAGMLLRQRRSWEVGVLLALLVYGLGGAALLDTLPVFRVFRNPSRIFLILVFPVSTLAADTLHQLQQTGWDESSRRPFRKVFLAVCLLTVLPTLSCLGLGIATQGMKQAFWPPFIAYWSLLAVAIPVCLALGWLATPSRAHLRTGLLAAVLVLEMLMPVANFVNVRPMREIYPQTELISELQARGQPGTARVLDWYAGTESGAVNSPQGIGAAMPLVLGYETANGYNPLDVRSYREFLYYLVGGEGPLKPLQAMTLPILPNLASRRRTLMDHLNVSVMAVPEGVDRKQFDPTSWNAVRQVPGGVPLPLISRDAPKSLPSYTLFENPTVLPRVWVVPEAKPMPEGQEAQALGRCDFRKTVLLTGVAAPEATTGPSASASIRSYRANQVVIDVQDGTGWLVLADVWFPGWVCQVDGQEVSIERANHTFRAIRLPAGAREVVFRFEPHSYHIGRGISLIGLGLLAMISLSVGIITGVLRRQQRSSPIRDTGNES